MVYTSLGMFSYMSSSAVGWVVSGKIRSFSYVTRRELLSFCTLSMF